MSHQAMLGDVLQEGTEDYVGDHDRRVFEAEIAEIQKAEKEREEAEARRKEQEKETEKIPRIRAVHLRVGRKPGLVCNFVVCAAWKILTHKLHAKVKVRFE